MRVPRKYRPICPSCGREAALSPTQYGIRAECCGLWSWDLKPLVDAETHAARKLAHSAFDPLWRLHVLSRSEAYRRLREKLGLPEEDCHMAQMPAELARRVPDAVAAIWKDLGR